MVFLGDDIRYGKVSFVFLEACRHHMHTWYEKLKTKHVLVDAETGQSSYFEDSDAIYAEFDSNGRVVCYNESTVTYHAEVPCDTVNDGRLIFTKEMCERKVDVKNCLEFNHELSNPTYRPVLRCGIGSICHHKYTTTFATVTRCPSAFKLYEIFPSRFFVDDVYVSPTINEYLALKEQRSKKLFYSSYADLDEDHF